MGKTNKRNPLGGEMSMSVGNNAMMIFVFLFLFFLFIFYFIS